MCVLEEGDGGMRKIDASHVIMPIILFEDNDFVYTLVMTSAPKPEVSRDPDKGKQLLDSKADRNSRWLL